MLEAMETLAGTSGSQTAQQMCASQHAQMGLLWSSRRSTFRRRKASRCPAQAAIKQRSFNNPDSKFYSAAQQRKEMKEMAPLMPDRLSDPLLDVADLSRDPYALASPAQKPGGQAALRSVDGVTLQEWDDALTIRELYQKYDREFAMTELQERAIELHHEQRARHTVPSYGQALALANLMEQMHMEDADADPDRVPPWIRAHFVMEERWGELESEYFAAAEAIKLAEAWGISDELQDKIDRFDPELFEGEPDPPAPAGVIDSLLEGVLPGTAGYIGSSSATSVAALQQDYVADILPEAGPGEEEGGEEQLMQGDTQEIVDVEPPVLGQ